MKRILPTGQEFCTFINLSWWTYFVQCSETPADTEQALCCKLSKQYRWHEVRKLTVWALQSITLRRLLNCLFKNRKTTPYAGWLVVHHTPVLCPIHSTYITLCVCPLCPHASWQGIFSNTLDLHLELQAVFTQTLQKGTINNSTEKCYVSQNVV